jgi:Protein of unknown function (DUF2911)
MSRRGFMNLAGMVFVAVLAVMPLHGQTPRVRVSARGTVDGTVDQVHITMEYGRPTKRGRQIWGALVPWGKWWMPGADESTSIVTDHPLRVASLLVPAGTHTIYALPAAETFTLIINNQTGQFHTVYHPDQDLGRVPMTMTRLDEPVELMTFAVTPNGSGGGALALRWDDREYSVEIAAPADARPGDSSR